MSPTENDKLALSVFALGLSMGFVRREAVVKWADRRIAECSAIAEGDAESDWLTGISLSQSKQLLELIGEMKEIADEVDRLETCKAAYALVPNADAFSPSEAEDLAKLVYRITHRCHNANWRSPLLKEIDAIADGFCHVRHGYSDLNEEQAARRFFDFVARNRLDGFAEMVSPVQWCYRPRTAEPIPQDAAQSLFSIGISAWVIQDGNYSDFAAGDRTEFALEFHPVHGLKTTTTADAIAEHITARRYKIRGQIVFVGPGVWVIDTGVFVAYKEQKPPAYAVAGAWVEGEIEIGVDPFFYFERLHQLDGMPPLSYRWRVRQIIVETTPWIRVRQTDGRKHKMRDRSKESYMPTRETKAWTADGGHAHYILRCERISGPDMPSRSKRGN